MQRKTLLRRIFSFFLVCLTLNLLFVFIRSTTYAADPSIKIENVVYVEDLPEHEESFMNNVQQIFCSHDSVSKYIIDSTCSQEGIEYLVCDHCGKVLSSDMIAMKEHNFRNKIVVNVACDHSGEMIQVCTECGALGERTIVKALPHTMAERISREPTCSQVGNVEHYCTVCGNVISNEAIPTIPHNFEITDTVHPDPVHNGYHVLTCTECGATSEEPLYWEPLGERDLCIPSIGLHVPVTAVGWSQAAVDCNDVCINTSFMGSVDEPIILGHNTRSLGILQYTKVNDLIYYTENGVTKTYQVWCSDVARETDGGWNIRTFADETPCISLYGREMLHFYTCHRDPYYGKCRWMVLADRID